jgi:hypothetical protein
MKRTAIALLVLITLFGATSLLAGGKTCDIKSHAAKNVDLTGSLSWTADHKAVFHVANSDESYTVCEKTKASVLKQTEGATLRVKGKVVSCGEGKELVIEEAKSI